MVSTAAEVVEGGGSAAVDGAGGGGGVLFGSTFPPLSTPVKIPQITRWYTVPILNTNLCYLITYLEPNLC
jgi:hypothetical protein